MKFCLNVCINLDKKDGSNVTLFLQEKKNAQMGWNCKFFSVSYTKITWKVWPKT